MLFVLVGRKRKKGSATHCNAAAGYSVLLSLATSSHPRQVKLLDNDDFNFVWGKTMEHLFYIKKFESLLRGEGGKDVTACLRLSRRRPELKGEFIAN